MSRVVSRQFSVVSCQFSVVSTQFRLQDEVPFGVVRRAAADLRAVGDFGFVVLTDN
jgi:hypothetical protein